MDDAFPALYSLIRRLLEHDEVLKARALLRDCVPWDLRQDPRVVDLKLLVDAQLAHLDRPEEYWRMYEDYGIEKETIPLDWPILPEYSQHARFQAAMELVRPGMKVLDVGSYDGWFVNRAGRAGAHAFGIDASHKMVALANQVARDGRTGARFAVCRFGSAPTPESFPSQFDLVVCMEMYEHVEDTLVLLRNLRPLVAPGGALFVSTPHGSWLRGMRVDYGPSWDGMHPKEHVRAPTPEDLEGDLRAFFRDVTVRSIPVGHPPVCEPVPGQATLVAVARA